MPGFDARENRIVFARALLDLPLPGANPQVAQQCEAQCKALLARRRVRAGSPGASAIACCPSRGCCRTWSASPPSCT